MGIITVIYIIVFFILTMILLVSIVVLKNERELNRIREQCNIKKIDDKSGDERKSYHIFLFFYFFICDAEGFCNADS